MWLVFDNFIIFCYNIGKGVIKMVEYRYEVWCENVRLAADMQLEDAVIFVEAYFNKYYAEPMDITIKRKEA
jgi:hypothetical protein